MRMKILYIRDAERTGISRSPNLHKTGGVIGVKGLYYGKNTLSACCGNYTYNVSSEPEIYYNIAH